MRKTARATTQWLRDNWLPILIGIVVGGSFGLVFCTDVVIDWPPCQTLPRRCPEF